jgi:hypothetical protein
MSNVRTRIAAGFLGIALVAAHLGCTPASKTPPPSTTPSTKTAPLKVTGVTLGRSLGADKSIAERTDTFTATDTFYASVRTEGSASGATVKARWTYEDGQLVDETSQTIAPTGGGNFTEFHVSKPDGWPLGSYAVEVFVNGTSAQRKTFNVT